MKLFRWSALIVTFLLFGHTSRAQSVATKTDKPLLLTADSLASGNYKDVLTSFFQLAFNNLSGEQKNLEFASNPFAIMARSNPSLLVDSSYVKYQHLRALNFNVGLFLDNSYHLTGFNFAVKYAIVNKRDISISHKFVGDNITRTEEYRKFNNLIGKWVSKNLAADREFAMNLNKQINLWENKDTFSFGMLPEAVRDTVMAIVNNRENGLNTMSRLLNDNPNLVFRKVLDSIYNDLQAQWQNKPLWTVGGSSKFKTVSTGGAASKLGTENIELFSEFLAGINNQKSKVKMDVDILANYKFIRDTTYSPQNLLTNLFEFQPGFNFVFKSRQGENGSPGRPLFEFKISGSYYHNFSSLLPGQKADSNTINGEVRLRIYQDIWVPVSIKYDPSSGNVFGFLSVKANFTALAGALKLLQ